MAWFFRIIGSIAFLMGILMIISAFLGGNLEGSSVLLGGTGLIAICVGTIITLGA